MDTAGFQAKTEAEVDNPRLMALLALTLFCAACGVKTPPYPAPDILPQSVRRLAQTVTEEGELVLSWLPPETNMMGRPLKALGAVRIGLPAVSAQ